MNLSDWLNQATHRLKQVNIPSPNLDAELILISTLSIGKIHLRAHSDWVILPDFLPILEARLQLRLERVPIAYILGKKEFYGREFKVTPSTLVPRPESEDVVEMMKIIESCDDKNFDSTPPSQSRVTYEKPSVQATKKLIDIGTGSGILGITLKLELPHLAVYLSDISQSTLHIAKLNAQHLKASVKTLPPSDLFSKINGKYNYIVANLPYVDKSWPDISPELAHEPAGALFADQGGLGVIFKLITQAPAHMQPNSYLLLEADPSEHAAIINHAKTHSLTKVKQLGYCLAFNFST